MSETSFDPERALEYVGELRRRARQLEQEVRDTEIDVTSRDKSITVTVTIPGKISGLTLDRSAFEDRDPNEVSKAVLDTVRTAQEVAERAGQDLVRRHLPNLPNFTKVLTSAFGEGRNCDE